MQQQHQPHTSLRFSARLLLVSLAAVLCWAMSYHNCRVEAFHHISEALQTQALIDSAQKSTPSAPQQPLSPLPVNIWEIESEGESPAPAPENDDDDDQEKEEEENQREREEQRHNRSLYCQGRKFADFLLYQSPFCTLAEIPTLARAYARLQSRAQWSVNVERYALYHQWRLHA